MYGKFRLDALYFGIAHLGVERLQRRDEHLQIGPLFHDDAFNLVKLRKVGTVNGFLSEYTVNRKDTARFGRVLRKVLDRVHRGMRPQQRPFEKPPLNTSHPIRWNLFLHRVRGWPSRLA